MGLSSQAIVMGIISQVYTLDLQINQLYQEKFAIARWAQQIGLKRSRAIGAADGQVLLFRQLVTDVDQPSHIHWDRTIHTNIDISPGGAGMFHAPNHAVIESVPRSTTGMTPQQRAQEVYAAHKAWVDAQRGVAPPAGVEPRKYYPSAEVIDAAGNRVAPGQAAPGAGEGERYMKKEEAEAMCDVYLADLNSKEKEVDMKLESLKAQRVALNSQREEFTKYVAEGIKMAFKNNYA